VKRLPMWIHRLFRSMVATYPAATRLEFGEEMLDVFDETMLQLAHESYTAQLAFFLRELKDWPHSVLSAYYDELQRRWSQARNVNQQAANGLLIESEVMMNASEQLGSQGGRQSFLIALPPLLLGLGIMVAALIRTDVWYRLPAWQLYLSFGITLLPGVIIGGVGLLAFFRRIPDWGITWVGTAFMGFVLFTQVLLGELVDEGTILLPPLVEAVLGMVFFLTGLALLLLLAIRDGSRSGLFTLAAAATMGLALLQAVTAAPFNRDDLALLAGPLGLGFALLIYLYCLKPGAGRWAALALTALLNAGVVFIAAFATSEWRLSPAPIEIVPVLLVLITGLLASGPLSGLLMKPILRRRT
jgi:hypothetical protein